MREFTDEGGRRWVAAVRRDPGPDYKWRWYLVLAPAGEEAGGEGGAGPRRPGPEGPGHRGRDDAPGGVGDPTGGPGAPVLPVPEIRWNSEEAAALSLAQMHEGELRRRLRAVLGRGSLTGPPRGR